MKRLSFYYILPIIALCNTLQFEGFSSNNEKRIPLKQPEIVAIKRNIVDSIYLKEEVASPKELKIFVNSNNQTNIFKDILPILTLMLGILINRGIDRYSERKKIKRIGERWKAELSSLELPITNQITFLNNFLIEHEKENFTVCHLTISTSLNGEAFTSLDKTDLIKYLEIFRSKSYKDAVISANKINSFSGILSSDYKQINEKFSNYLSETSTYIKSLTNDLQLLMKSFAKYQVVLEIEYKTDPIIEPNYYRIFDLFKTKILPNIDNGNFEVYDLEKNFFIPLTYIFAEMRLDGKIDHMSEYTTNCLNSIKGIKMEKKYLSDNMRFLIKNYEAQLNHLTSLLKEL